MKDKLSMYLLLSGIALGVAGVIANSLPGLIFATTLATAAALMKMFR